MTRLKIISADQRRLFAGRCSVVSADGDRADVAWLVNGVTVMTRSLQSGYQRQPDHTSTPIGVALDLLAEERPS